MRLPYAPGSVLWLKRAGENPKATSGRRPRWGVDPKRLVLPAQLEVHLARHQLADLFLDTSPTMPATTCDAVGEPAGGDIRGTAYARRVAASL